MKELKILRNELKAPKTLYNSYAKYYYRSCESILEALKPLLREYDCELMLDDEIVECAGRAFIKATATLINREGDMVATSAFAECAVQQSGMTASQITGCASSYAHKYCLSSLFLIDDTKDADTDEYHKDVENAEIQSKKDLRELIASVEKCNTIAELTELFNTNPAWQTCKEFMQAMTERKQVILAHAAVKNQINNIK